MSHFRAMWRNHGTERPTLDRARHQPGNVVPAGQARDQTEKKLSRKALLTFAVEQQGGATSVRTMQRIERLQAIDSVPEVRALLELIKAGLMKVGTAERLVFRHLRGSRSRYHPE
jgi:hypothetical protein